MKIVKLAVLFGLPGALSGCLQLSDAQQGDERVSGVLSVGDLTDALDAPPITTGQIRVRFVNEATVDADIRLTMRVAGQMVHQSNRRVPKQSASVLVGPDRADSILVEVTQLKNPEPRSLPAAAYFLGLDFTPDQLVDIRIEGDPPVVVPQEPEQPEPQPEPEQPSIVVVVDSGDTLGVVEIDPNQFIDIPANPGGALPIPSPIPPPGGIAPFPGWGTGGPTAPFPGSGPATPQPDPTPAPNPGSTDGVIAVVVDIDADPTNGNETLIPVEPGNRPGEPVRWNPGGLAPGVYLVYTEELIDGVVRRIGPGPTALRVNAPPVLVFENPIDGATFGAGDTLPIGFVGSDDDNDAQISIFLDRDNLYAGDEVILGRGISENDPAQRTLLVDTTGFEPGVYYVGGVIDDGVARAVAYSGAIEIAAKVDGN